MLQLNKDIIKLESVSSTNDFAKELLLSNLPNADITIIDTVEQTKGRGQKGNYWESEKGKNATLSFIIKPVFLRPEQQFYLSMAISLAIVSCLKPFVQNISIKWPNDIYVNNKKICGILIENSITPDSIQTAIIGIGLNINQNNFSDWIPNPTSIKSETGKNFSIEIIKNELYHSLEKYYTLLLEKSFETIHKEYLNTLYLKNIFARFEDINGVFDGKINTVYSTGVIEIVKSNNEINQYSFKEVKYILD